MIDAKTQFKGQRLNPRWWIPWPARTSEKENREKARCWVSRSSFHSPVKVIEVASSMFSGLRVAEDYLGAAKKVWWELSKLSFPGFFGLSRQFQASSSRRRCSITSSCFKSQTSGFYAVLDTSKWWKVNECWMLYTYSCFGGLFGFCGIRYTQFVLKKCWFRYEKNLRNVLHILSPF